MPRKIRQLKADLRRAGASIVRQRGSHTTWQHTAIAGVLVELAGHDGDDAHQYQERDVRDALRRIAAAKEEDTNDVNEYPHYSMTIQWSGDDEAYIVSFPEWEAAGHIAHTHGATYEEAVGRGREALELLVESALKIGADLPAPRTFTERQAI